MASKKSSAEKIQCTNCGGYEILATECRYDEKSNPTTNPGNPLKTGNCVFVVFTALIFIIIGAAFSVSVIVLFMYSLFFVPVLIIGNNNTMNYNKLKYAGLLCNCCLCGFQFLLQEGEKQKQITPNKHLIAVGRRRNEEANRRAFDDVDE